MAKTIEKRKKQQKGRTASKKPDRKTSGATPKEAIPGDQDAGDLLRTAIDEEVKANSRKIAKAMVDRTIGGNAGVARLLVDFTGAKKPRKSPVKKPGGPSIAEQWTVEPRWVDPSGPDAGDGTGGREPEALD